MKRMFLQISFWFVCNIVCGQLPNVQNIKDLKNGLVHNDKSYVYRLPFELGKKVLLVQAAYSKLSHKGEIALDFKVKLGTPICAARDGIVIAVYSESNRGGIGDKYLNDGNHIIIEHNDKSRALYWHLQFNGAFVKIGDTVNVGQLIGKSGNTGYSAFPHLHFEINEFTAEGTFTQVPARFYTKKGVKYLRPMHKYKVV